MPTSRVVTKNGAAYLEVNGEIVPGAAYITYFFDNNRYGDFAKAGYKLYSVSVFLGQNYINNRSALECFTPGVFGDGAADFSRFDPDIRRILEVCPDAMIFPRVNVNPSREWERMHLEELTEAGPSTGHPDGKRAEGASFLGGHIGYFKEGCCRITQRKSAFHIHGRRGRFQN